MTLIKIIICSTRPKRFAPHAAAWFMERIALYKDEDISFDLLDLKDYNLPLLDEPEEPAGNNHIHEHTKKWATAINEADGFVFIHPEYNHGISGALKNAIDFLWQEWNYKPLAFVGYGAEAGGARAAEHLRGVAAQLKMFDLREQILLTNYSAQVDDAGNFMPTDRNNRSADRLIRELAFWTHRLKPLREERQKQVAPPAEI